MRIGIGERSQPGGHPVGRDAGRVQDRLQDGADAVDVHRGGHHGARGTGQFGGEEPFRSQPLPGRDDDSGECERSADRPQGRTDAERTDDESTDDERTYNERTAEEHTDEEREDGASPSTTPDDAE
jgi:hypothetical protein